MEVIRGSRPDLAYDELLRQLKTSRTPADVDGALRDAEAMHRVRANSLVYRFVATAVPADMFKAPNR